MTGGNEHLGRRPNQPFVLSVGQGFWPRRWRAVALARSWLIARFVRAALNRNRVILLIGETGSGKTLLLERATPGRIIDHSQSVLNAGIKGAVNVAEIPHGPFSIDETMCHDAASVLRALEVSRGRGFALSLQDVQHIKLMGLSQELSRNHRCVFVNITRRARALKAKGQRTPVDAHR